MFKQSLVALSLFAAFSSAHAAVDIEKIRKLLTERMPGVQISTITKTPYAELYHYESATRGYEDTPDKQARLTREGQYLKQRWGDLLLNDPAYSPNLTLNHDDFSLAWPPRFELVSAPARKTSSQLYSIESTKP